MTGLEMVWCRCDGIEFNMNQRDLIVATVSESVEVPLSGGAAYGRCRWCILGQTRLSAETSRAWAFSVGGPSNRAVLCLSTI